MKLEKIKTLIPYQLYKVLEKENIKELRPCQVKAIKNGLFENKNLLVCTPTASGKTLIAELAALKTIAENKGKIIYSVPLKALANEKFKDFKRKYTNLGVRIALSIGDLDSADSYLAKYDLIICSNEKLDSLIRHGAPWLDEVSILIVDEIHLLDSVERGPTLEILITMLKKLLKDIQIIALSATIGNPKELASWLNASLIIDNWRPVKLYEGIYFKDKVDFYKQKKKELIQRLTKEEAIDLALDTIKINKQAFIFVNSKRSAEASAEKIAREIKNTDLNNLSEKILSSLSTPTKQCERLAKCIKKGIAFHHSGLVSKQRELIENSFRSGLIKIICCTPTLAFGVDLPAFRVLLKDLRRYGAFGLKWIPVLEMKQFSGRAGRPSFDNFGEAICTAKTENEKKEIYERYIKGKIEDVYSKLAVEPVLRMYLLSLIAINFTRTKEEIINFFKETFWAYQFKDIEKINSKIGKILTRLEKYKFIKSENKKYFATNLGKRISQLYIDPETAWHFINCIKRVKIPKEISFLQAICNTIEMRPLLSVRAKEYEDIQSSLIKDEDSLLETVSEFDFQYETFLNSYKTALMIKDWANEKTEEEILENFKVRPGELNVKLANSDWLLYCVKEIATLLGEKKVLNELAKLRVRLKYGIKEELLALVRLKNIGRVRARRLFKNNIKNIRDIKKASFNLLKIILGQKIAEDIKKQVGIDIDKVP